MADDKKYTRNQLVKKTQSELIDLWVNDEGLDITDLDGAPKPTKAVLIAALTDIDAVDEEELEDELEEELDEEEEVEAEEEPDVEEEEELPDEEEDDLELPEEEEEDDIEEEAPAPAAKKTRTPKAKKTEDTGDGSGTMAAKQGATLLGTEAKTLRQFFRSAASTVEAVGSGGRYEFNESDLPKITEEFNAWKAGHGARGNKRSGEGGPTKKSRKAAEAPIVEEIEELEIEDLEEEELELEDED